MNLQYDKLSNYKLKVPQSLAEYVELMGKLEKLDDGPGVKPIGYQPLPRPAEQWGWTFELLGGQDFEQIPYVTAFTFPQSQKLSEKYLEKFKNGESLFPKDPTSELADKILKSHMISSEILEPMLNNLLSDKFGITKKQFDFLKGSLKDIAVSRDKLPTYSAIQKGTIENDWNLKSSEFFKSVGVGYCRVTDSGKLEVKPPVHAFDIIGRRIN